MPALLIRHHVADFDRWKAAFDAEDAVRRTHGCLRSHLFRSIGTGGEMLILLEWDNLDRAWMFAQSDDLRATLPRTDGDDEPDLWLLTESSRMRI